VKCVRVKTVCMEVDLKGSKCEKPSDCQQGNERQGQAQAGGNSPAGKRKSRPECQLRRGF